MCSRGGITVLGGHVTSTWQSFLFQFVEDKNKKTSLTFPIILAQIFYHPLLQTWTYYTVTVYSNFLATTRLQFRLLSLLWFNLQNNLKAIIFIIFWLMFLYFRWWALCCGVLGCDCIERKVFENNTKMTSMLNNNLGVGTGYVANRLFPSLTALTFFQRRVNRSITWNLSTTVQFKNKIIQRGQTLSFTILHLKYSIFKWHSSFHLATAVSLSNSNMPAHTVHR